MKMGGITKITEHPSISVADPDPHGFAWMVRLPGSGFVLK
jgi:hypothetical protein